MKEAMHKLAEAIREETDRAECELVGKMISSHESPTFTYSRDAWFGKPDADERDE